MNVLTERFLASRGLTEEDLVQIDDPSHPDLAGIRELCQVLDDIKKSGRQITVLPDFDCDGIMSAVIGFAGLSQLGFNVSLFVPDPAKGYGFGVEEIDRLVRENPMCSAIITCDVGITCHDGIARAKEHGLQVLVTDHHEPARDEDGGLLLPAADLIVDPMICEYPHKGICGAHVLWQVLDTYACMYTDQKTVDSIGALRLFAGIGTISDMMPLLYENRALVKDSLFILRSLWAAPAVWNGGLDPWYDAQACPVYKNAFFGLRSLLASLSDRCHLKKRELELDEGLYGFYIAPAMNAIKRMGEDMHRVFDLFFCPAARQAEAILAVNDKRKELVKDWSHYLQTSYQPYAPWIYVSDAPAGIQGLVANDVMKKTGMPALALCASSLSGSGRSPAWFDFLDQMRPGSDVFMAGHQGAFGIRFLDREQMAAFLPVLSEKVMAVYDELPADKLETRPDVTVSFLGAGDIGMDPDVIREFVHDTERLAPFGRGFEAPLVRFRITGQDVTWRKVGKGGAHLLGDMIDGTLIQAWNMGPYHDQIVNSPVLELDGRFLVDIQEENEHLAFKVDAIKNIT